MKHGSDPLELSSIASGRRPSAVILDYTRDLTPDDLRAAQTTTQLAPVGPSTLTKLSFKHHSLAQLVAQGRTGAEISALTGYTTSRISYLKRDPAFMELIEYYRTQHLDIYSAVHEKLATLGVTAIDSLQDHLEESPEDFSIREKIEVAEMALDRSIAPTKGAPARGGPSSGLTVNIQFQKPPTESTIQTIDVIPSRKDPLDE